MAVCRG